MPSTVKNWKHQLLTLQINILRKRPTKTFVYLLSPKNNIVQFPMSDKFVRNISSWDLTIIFWIHTVDPANTKLVSVYQHSVLRESIVYFPTPSDLLSLKNNVVQFPMSGRFVRNISDRDLTVTFWTHTVDPANTLLSVYQHSLIRESIV